MRLARVVVAVAALGACGGGRSAQPVVRPIDTKTAEPSALPAGWTIQTYETFLAATPMRLKHDAQVTPSADGDIWIT